MSAWQWMMFGVTFYDIFFYLYTLLALCDNLEVLQAGRQVTNKNEGIFGVVHAHCVTKNK